MNKTDLSLEQRAHDIAVRILPQMMEVELLDYVASDERRSFI